MPQKKTKKTKKTQEPNETKFPKAPVRDNPNLTVPEYSLTGAEDDYIRNHMNDAGPGVIAAFLARDNPNITETIVRTHIHKIKDLGQRSRSRQLMAGREGITIMTQEASERADSVKDKMHKKTKDAPHIFKINPNKK